MRREEGVCGTYTVSPTETVTATVMRPDANGGWPDPRDTPSEFTCACHVSHPAHTTLSTRAGGGAARPV